MAEKGKNRGIQSLSDSLGRLGILGGLLVTFAAIAGSQPPQTELATDTEQSGASQPRIPQPMARLGLGQANQSGDGVQLAGAGDMIGFSHSDGSGTQTITLVHTGKSWMAVYHIDRSGTIRLVSSRPIDADFSLQLNATSPLPEEIRQIGRR